MPICFKVPSTKHLPLSAVSFGRLVVPVSDVCVVFVGHVVQDDAIPE